MSHSEAMGSNVNNLMLALDGRMDMLKAIFGGAEKDDDEKAKTVPMTPTNFRAMARRHNAVMKRGK